MTVMVVRLCATCSLVFTAHRLRTDGSVRHGTTTVVVMVCLFRTALAHEQDFLDKLPSANMYEKSFMHRDRLSHIVVAPTTDFVITAR